MIVQKAFKYRFFPTDAQSAQLASTFGCARFVYNQALNYRSQGDSGRQSKAWAERSEAPGTIRIYRAS
ncbi:MAG TPA: helix-turn-helix domain-containing protein, partial [Blastocatellia bacterium]